MGLSPKQKFRFTSKFGIQEKLPYSHSLYEYLCGLVDHCKSKYYVNPLEVKRKVKTVSGKEASSKIALMNQKFADKHKDSHLDKLE